MVFVGTNLSQYILRVLRDADRPMSITELLDAIHARSYDYEIRVRASILTLINLGEIGIDGESLLLSLPERKDGV